MSEAWSAWVGHVVNGVFPLKEYLGGSERSAVFLTEPPGIQSAQAAIKLVAADVDAAIQLSRWRRAQTLCHPHLIRIFDSGRCQIEERELLFVVMEYAEESLAKIIPERALTETETREMLWPALDALAYLHGQELVHGRLKPANILAIKDHLKLASDGICAAGELDPDTAKPDDYDSPERASSAEADIWSLGMTLAVVLTRHVPLWNRQEWVDPILPEGLPESFSDVVHGCLRRDPARRWSLGDIAIRLQPDSAPVLPSPSVQSPSPQPADAKPAVATPSVTTSRPGRVRVFGLALLVVAIVLLGWKVIVQREGRQQPPKSSDQQQGATVPRSKPSPVPTRPEARPTSTTRAPADSNNVVQQVLPNVPQSARDTIQGTIRVSVRVQVDGAGGVTGAELDSSGPSQYFARLSLQAAQGWKFAPSSQNTGRTFILHFQFTDHDTKASAARAAS